MIDVSFSFTSDTPGYWDGYWDGNDGLGYGKADPDNASPTLHRYHQQLWSKKLPNGEVMDLKMGEGAYYLTWRDFRFGSDAIIISFRYKKYKYMIDQVKARIPDYQAYYTDILKRAYTIGGMMIFPKHPSSMNQNKGTNSIISDRWDLTLECIRRYYQGQESPLYKTILKDKDFYDLFVDFKGFVDYFFFQDCVSYDYSAVNIWCGDGKLEKPGLPETIDDYFTFIDKEFDFMNKRNARIHEYALENNL